MKKYALKFISLSLAIAAFVCALPAQAAGLIEIEGGTSLTTLSAFLDRFINLFLVELVGIGAFISLIVGGFMYLTAGVDTQRVETSKKVITYAIIGLALTALSFGLFMIAINIINSIF